MKKVRHLLSMADLSRKELVQLLDLAAAVKKFPKKFHKSLYEKVLLTFFQMPSLRTEVSFDVAMFTMGGEIVDYHSETSPWANGKERLEDVAQVVARYVDAVMIRMHDHQELLKFAKNCSVPVINGLTSYEHPCQVLADVLTMREKFGDLQGKKIAYLGDCCNNTTHSLLLGCAMMGMEIRVACPKLKEYLPDAKIVKIAQQFAKKYKGKVVVTADPKVAVKGVDVVYTDSWMSYRVPPEEKNRRVKDLRLYQVTAALMRLAKKSAVFMHDLPALRGQEVTAEVIDGKQSIVFDQAENRLHTEKAVLLFLLKKK
ncbi:MAG: ornithine carbamoyltransferase [Nanoarchaeota archaeon]|nr:ornithine carbamoyltransferase [Nanoarchaeota archaeon]